MYLLKIKRDIHRSADSFSLLLPILNEIRGNVGTGHTSGRFDSEMGKAMSLIPLICLFSYVEGRFCGGC